MHAQGRVEGALSIRGDAAGTRENLMSIVGHDHRGVGDSLLLEVRARPAQVDRMSSRCPVVI